MPLRESMRRGLVCLLFPCALTSDVIVATGCCDPCCGNCIPPGVDACNEFLSELPEACIYTVPLLVSCEVYDNENYEGCEGELEDYFACLSELAACNPETGEPNVLAWLPCAAYADFAGCQ